MKIYDGMRVLLAERHREKAGDEAVRVIAWLGRLDWAVLREGTGHIIWGPCSEEQLQDRVDEGFYVPVEFDTVPADVYFGGAHDEPGATEGESSHYAGDFYVKPLANGDFEVVDTTYDPQPGDEEQEQPVMPGGSPIFPSADYAERKATPVVTGVFDYFPLALLEVAKISKQGNDQHNPGQPLHWARGKSFDHANCIGRHLLERGCIDPEDGQRHSAKLAWRALALLQKELELEQGYDRDAGVE